ncbi:uncharacterized protein N7482_001275 [Penicillium canariense]|uniref:Uncharacterized protein n=1 Tax=Penicillium canariense TaxID=189055 RepID=A0A9W9LSS7_9EURO|nr:uncharacterized protein N7482_001275 [Penicillium canariense]KAJ5175398.1 hypothetical protein N7482_001275 [Penicillium canariense]
MVNWKFAAMTLPALKQVLPQYAQRFFSVGTESVFKPDASKTCLKFNEKDDDEPCCGCYEMDWYYGYGDIPPYDGCDACATTDTVCTWPDGYKRGTDFDSARFCSTQGLSSKRDVIATDKDDTLADDDDTDGDEGLTLYERDYNPNNPTATISRKTVSLCTDKYSVGKDGRYPAFPKLADRPWDGIENGRWETISKYWGNTSESCTDWSVDAIFPHDNRSTPRGLKRARYEKLTLYTAEHVFEGQLMGDFFTWWLNKGTIRDQIPPAINPTQVMGCSQAKDYVTADDIHWSGANSDSFFDHMLFELGSIGHLDRLTIFLGRPNGMKGAMFKGIAAISTSSSRTGFSSKDADAQLQSVKEMGMVFEYLNNPKVWQNFCATFEAVYDLLGEFDDYHAQQGTGLPAIQPEWPKYIRTTLKSISNRSGIALFNYFRLRAQPNNAYFNTLWMINMRVNYGKLSFTGTCPHLP